MVTRFGVKNVGKKKLKNTEKKTKINFLNLKKNYDSLKLNMVLFFLFYPSLFYLI